MYSIWGGNISGWFNFNSTIHFCSFQRTVMCLLLSYKLKGNVCIPFRLHFRVCFDFHLALSSFFVMGSNILSFHWSYCKSYCLMDRFSVALSAGYFVFREPYFKAETQIITFSSGFRYSQKFWSFGILIWLCWKPQSSIIEQSDLKLKKMVCVNLSFIEFTLRTISNCIVLI